MMTSLTALLVTLLATSAQTDTTIKVHPGARLNVNNFGGDIAVQAWGKNVLRIEAAHAERMKIFIEDQGSEIAVTSHSRRRLPGRVDYRIHAPEWMPLTLTGVYTDISVESTKSAVSAETVQGNVRLLGGQGFIKLSSVQGMVCVVGARGRLELSSVNQGVNVSDVEGDISVDAVNGDVNLDRVRSKVVEAATVNGDVIYIGDLREDGRYSFSSHSGDLILAVPENTSARFKVATFNGEFESAFPVSLSQAQRGRRFDFTLGSGGAQIDLETFMGTVSLQRAPAIKERLKQKDKDKDKNQAMCPDPEDEEER